MTDTVIITTPNETTTVAVTVENVQVIAQEADNIIVSAVGLQGPPGPGTEAPINPEITYSSGRISRIDYSNGSFKVFSYDALNGYRLDYFDYTNEAVTTRKQLVYNLDGTLHEIVQTII